MKIMKTLWQCVNAYEIMLRKAEHKVLPIMLGKVYVCIGQGMVRCPTN